MTLTIDKKRIDFTLETEKYLDEVITNINNWLSENQLLIEKLYVNNEDYSNMDLHIPLEDVNIIDIETLSFTELNINNISWIKYFFERIILAINDWDSKILEQVKVEIPFVLGHLPSILSLDSKTPETIFTDKITEMLNEYNYFNCKEEVVDKKEVNTFLDNIVKLLSERLNEFLNAEEELKSSIVILGTLKGELESVSIYLQSGKQEKAAVIMNKFTNILHKILRILNYNSKNSEFTRGKSLEEFTDGLDDILTDLLDGYESKDTVLIGDILEYELSPRIDSLQEIFN